jgi:uncharacterized protein YdaU (DUF1376 family)
MKWYPGDYLGDTRHLTTEQHGAYLLLLMTMWRAGGWLPDDALKLARWAGVTPYKWEKIGAEVLAFFVRENGCVSQRRLLKELANYLREIEKKSEGGKRGAQAKLLKNNKSTQGGASTNLKQPEPEPEPEKNKRGIDKSIPVGLVDQIWSKSSKPSRTRSGRPATSRAVVAAINKGATPESLLSSIIDHCRSAGEHAKGLHRIIESELWRDHMPKAEPAPSLEQQADRLARYRDTGDWPAHWGEKPRSAA